MRNRVRDIIIDLNGVNEVESNFIPTKISNKNIFNSSKNSNLIYQIKPDLTVKQIEFLNSLETYTERVNWLTAHNFQLYFVKIASEVFRTNLELIDSRLPEIVARLLLGKYIHGINKITDLVKYLDAENPCNFNLILNPHFYDYKIKRLLVDSALGMKAGTLWTGTFSANGGYIAVKKDGELLCYHIYNWNEFQEYLLSHTKIDIPDSRPHRCDFGTVLTFNEVEEPKGSFIKLNFQIRFL